MINVMYKKRGFKINSIWFCEDIDSIVSESKGDFIFIHGSCVNKYKNALIIEQLSLQTDLRVPLGEIFQQFNRTYRRHINKAKEEKIESVQYNSVDLKKNPYLLDSFKKEYEEFIKLKGIKNGYNEAAIAKYVNNENIILTKAFKGEESYAQHIFICEDNVARLLYTVSNFRSNEFDSNMVGRCNKYLHWNDIQYFHNNKFKVLDWGGINSKENTNGVDTFKKGFGGKDVAYYNIIIGKSLIGKVALKLLKLLKVKRG